jgi:hypothetical protein
MVSRTTTDSRTSVSHSSRRPPLPGRRPGVYLGVAAAGAVLVNVLVGTGPAAEAGTSESVSVAQQLGLSAKSGPLDVTEELQPLEDLAVSRSSRQAAETAAQQAQTAADRAAAAKKKAAAQAAARAAAAAAAARTAARTAAAVAERQTGATAAASIAATVIAHITNSAGAVLPQTQAAANAVVSNVPGAGSITLGGTRSSATDPDGHPSGKALDYMVLSDGALGDAIVAYHVAHWDELGVEYLIYRQRMLSSPGGSWTSMEDRGSPTANHMDHVHVNYR